MRLPLLKLHEKTLRMVWRIEKGGRSWGLVGTSHFFPYSFASSFERLLRPVETAVFEGPLDEESMRRIADYGRQGEGCPNLAELLEPKVIDLINWRLAKREEREGGFSGIPVLPQLATDYFRPMVSGVRPWLAFFNIWATCLDLRYSMDMEAYRIALRLGKRVLTLETIEEQLEVLDQIPLERIITQLSDVANWDRYQKRFTSQFVDGKLDELLALSGRFPTRTPVVINSRDRAQFERMQAIFEQGPAVAFVGIPHIPGVAGLFLSAGYTVTQVKT